MSELNTFKSERVGPFSDGVATIAAAGGGLVATFFALVVSPGGPAFVVVTWGLVIGGIVLAIAPGRGRALGPGLVFAGAAIPVAVFLWFWVAISGAVLFG